MAQLVTLGLPLLSHELSHGVGKQLAPLLEAFLGQPLELRVCASYSELGDALAEGKVDFAWLPPLEAAQQSAHGVGEILLQAVRAGAAHYYGALFVREDSPLKSVEDLAGKRIAWVDRRSTSGFLVVASLLHEHGVEVVQPPRFHRSHGAVIQAVADGDADAGATFVSILGDPASGTLSRAGWELVPTDPPCAMRAIATAGPIPADAICAWPGTSRRLRQAMSDAFAAAADDEAASALMIRLFGTERFEPADQTGFDVLEAARNLMATLRGEHP